MRPRLASPIATDRPCFLVPDVLTAGECVGMVEAAEVEGFTSPGRDYPATYRNNDRLVRDDATLASRLFARLRPSLPESIVDADGRHWRLTGLNTRFRYCRYRDGQRFGIHRDGAYVQAPGVRSHLTCMLYLNDARCFRGGGTRYYADRTADAALLGTVEPVAGAAVVFDHALWHDGEPVVGGVKYVMRTDVMYALEGALPSVGPGHDGYVWSVLGLRDGRLATGSRDRTVRIWEPSGQGWAPGAVLRGHGASVLALAEDGDDHLWSASRDRRVVRWDSVRPTEIGRHDGAVLCLARARDGRIASGGADGRVRLWPGGREVGAHAGWVWALAPLADGRLLSASEDGALRIWDPDGRLTAEIQVGPPQRAVAADDRYVYSGDADGLVCVWSIEGGWQRSGSVQAHAGAVCSMAAGGDALITGGEDDLLGVWSTADLSSRIVHRHDDFVRSVAVLAGGRVASASYDGTVRCWPLTRPGRDLGHDSGSYSSSEGRHVSSDPVPAVQ